MDEMDNTVTEIIAAITEQIEQNERRCIIIHGEIGAGKTRLAEALAVELKNREIRVGGIFSPRILDDNKTIGYRVCDIETGEEQSLATLNPPGIRIGKFYLSQDALTLARTAIEHEASADQVVFVDEVGRLELDEKGHAPALHVLLQSDAIPVLFVRTGIVDQIIDMFGIVEYSMFPAS